MEFDGNKPIYIQIAEHFCDRILGGELKGGDRILSVRELGAEIGVNPNTIMRSYEVLTEQGIIYNKRGIGYFISDSARDVVLDSERQYFVKEELPRLKKRAELLELNLKELI